MKARKILLATPLLKWYMEHGLDVTEVYQFIEFKPKACFKSFEEKVTEARREGDQDSSKLIIADTMKLIGNSAYGSMIMDKEKFHSVKYVNERSEACSAVNQPNFKKLTELDYELFEIESVKKSITLDLPIYLGYFVLQYAKLRMLEFYYDCLDELIDRSDFEYIEMDTDSAYIAISGKTLSDIVKKEKLAEYNSLLYGMCRDELTSEEKKKQWFPRECCAKHKKFDTKTPGLVKKEAEGDEMVALSSKTYVLQNGTEVKLSCKGLSHSSLDEPLEIYIEVMSSQVSKSGKNKGFRSRENSIFTYEQSRSGLTYFYCKREVLSDGVSTKPLNIVLSPFNIPPYIGFYNKSHPLSPDYASKISLYGESFSSAREAYNFALCTENSMEKQSFIQESKIKLSVEWLEKRRSIMKEILIEKMRTHEEVRKALRESNNLTLLFTVYDRYWGVGMGHRLAAVSEFQRGSNVLGLLWSEIRESFQSEI